MSPDPSHPTRHPGWCDPRLCTPTDVDVQHTSEPVTLRATDADFTFRLVQADEYAYPDEGRAELCLDITGTTLTGQDAQVVLLLHEIPRLAERLMTEYHRALLLGAPVVHAAVTS